MTDKLIEAIARAIYDCPDGNDYDKAQAAIDALKAEGVMLCRWEPTDDQGGSESFRRTFDLHPLRGYKLTGLEPPAAAITAALKETFKPNPSDNDKPPHNRGP